MRTFSQATATLLTMSLATPALAESWTPAWMASPQAVWRDTSVFETGLPDGIAGVTIRQPLTLGYGAAHLRLVLSNLHGTQPLPIDAVSLAQSAGAARVDAPQPVLFGGRPGTFIAPGATFVSDPVHFPAEAGARIAVTLTFGPGAVAEDFHWDARETSYLVDADRADPAVLSEIPARLTLSAVLSDRWRDRWSWRWAIQSPTATARRWMPWHAGPISSPAPFRPEGLPWSMRGSRAGGC
ncbi:hypothetical protein ACFQFQ_16695 [Sulfitobacter porphyrae]|uniref:Uncharacterized protein n=1 Tax=Sulfitobacter porphyrae TaxID=1246864 RepID=A0ABW2B7H8_9RHOB